MAKSDRKPPGTRPGLAPAWGVAVRTGDGTLLFSHRVSGTRLDWDGSPLTAWGRESQAIRFASEAEARAVAERMAVSSAAREYLVVPLPKSAATPTRRRG